MRTATLFVLLLMTTFTARAQTSGTVQGTVRSESVTLPGVNIVIEGTPIGTLTDADGRFELRNIPPGDYVLTAGMLGYARRSQTVDVTPGDTVVVEFALAEGVEQLDEVLVQGEQVYSAASSQSVRKFDLATRPRRSAQDLLRIAPGLITAQHAGGGKAEQIFLRGFDADHGTDVRVTVDGMPVNMVSHGHGQGYADLHFVIPEIVEQVNVAKGPYFPEYGNFATAGTVTLQTRDHLDGNRIGIEGGSFASRSLTALYSIPFPSDGHQGAYLASQYTRTDGPFKTPQDFSRFNMFGKFHTHVSEAADFSVSVSGFASAWNASGQNPLRAVERGDISRFGAVDDNEGGITGRQDVNVAYDVTKDNSRFRLRSYASRYRFKLFSDFTYNLENPAGGDMIEQTDDRRIVGLNGDYEFEQRIGPFPGRTRLGGGFRSDDANVGLWRSPDRIRTARLVDSGIAERNMYLWAGQELAVSSRIRLMVGLRGDYFTYDIEDELDAGALPAETDDSNPEAPVLPHASGYAHQAILSPKANLVFKASRQLDVFLNTGTGFHSNDARDVITGTRVSALTHTWRQDGMSEEDIDNRLAARGFDPNQRRATTLPRASGAEIGFRLHALRRFNLAAAAWVLDLDREFVYVGDGGFTEPSGATRRKGIDLEARFAITDRWSADADLNLARGHYRNKSEGSNEIALAPRMTSTGGITYRHPAGHKAALRYVRVGDRPADEAGQFTARGYTLVDLIGTVRIRDVQINLALENLLDTAWNEAQFAYTSRLPSEPAPVEGLHFTPGNPRNIRIGISYLF